MKPKPNQPKTILVSFQEAVNYISAIDSLRDVKGIKPLTALQLSKFRKQLVEFSENVKELYTKENKLLADTLASDEKTEADKKAASEQFTTWVEELQSEKNEIVADIRIPVSTLSSDVPTVFYLVMENFIYDDTK